MENIKYPLIGIIAVASDHESNYIFTEEEFQNVHFEKARKIILQNEKKLVNFIHGKYNNTKLAKKNPDWYWSNVSAFPPAKSSTFNDTVESLYLCRMNVFYRRNQEEIPFRRVPLSTKVANESLSAILGSIDFLKGLNIGELKERGLGYQNNLWSVGAYFGDEYISISLDMVDMKKNEEYPKLSLFLHRDGGLVPLTRDPFYEVEGAPDNLNGEWRLYAFSEKDGCYTEGYSIIVERELELDKEEERE